MDASRRLVIKSMALGSVAGLAMGSASSVLAGTAASSVRARSVLALANDDEAGALFLRGAGAGAQVAGGAQFGSRILSSELHVMLELERELRRAHELRMIGLLDDASGTLVVDLARSAGARVQWLGQHTIHAGSTRHHVVDAGDIEHCVRQFGRQLRASGARYELLSQRQGETPLLRDVGRQLASEEPSQWVAALGYQLASLDAFGRTQASSNSVVADGRFVSFLIER